MAMRRVSFEQAEAAARVLALETGDVGRITSSQRIGLAHEHFHLGEIVHVVFEMTADKNAETLFGILSRGHALFSKRDQLLERAARNQIQEFFLVAEVIVDARE